MNFAKLVSFGKLVVDTDGDNDDNHVLGYDNLNNDYFCVLKHLNTVEILLK